MVHGAELFVQDLPCLRLRRGSHGPRVAALVLKEHEDVNSHHLGHTWLVATPWGAQIRIVSSLRTGLTAAPAGAPTAVFQTDSSLPSGGAV